jgi:hypothetical protein
MPTVKHINRVFSDRRRSRGQSLGHSERQLNKITSRLLFNRLSQKYRKKAKTLEYKSKNTRKKKNSFLDDFASSSSTTFIPQNSVENRIQQIHNEKRNNMNMKSPNSKRTFMRPKY